jgi:formylglycine-generating enzyme required for sulfatase activity
VFLARLNEREQETDWVYRLPSEKEWEYACRGGPMSDPSQSAYDFYFDRPSNKLLPDQAVFGRDRSLRGRAKVGSGKPNSLGLYDMHGNMWELCDDACKPPGGKGPIHHRVRGGAWDSQPSHCRAGGYVEKGRLFSTEHYNRWASLGLRVARVRIDSRDR